MNIGKDIFISFGTGIVSASIMALLTHNMV